MAVKGPWEYANRYLCLSTDTKPTTDHLGAEAYETDTGDTYIYTGSEWVKE